MSSPVGSGSDLFKLNGNGMSNGNVDSNGVATFTFTAITVPGTETVEIDYSGVSGQFGPSVGNATLTVNNPDQPTQTVVTLSPNPCNPGDTVTVTATTTTTP